MKKKELNIVALPYYEVGACLDEFMSEVVGRALTLRPEPTNEVDALAIRAYDWQGRHVGYVANHSKEQAWKLLIGSGRSSLRGTAVAANVEHKCVVFQCKVETVGTVKQLYPEKPFTDWHYTGPVLKPTQERKKLDYMTQELMDCLDERPTWDDRQQQDFIALLEQFCTLSQHDISADMASYRRRLYLRLKGCNNAQLKRLADELRMSVGRMGRSLHGGAVCQYWMDILLRPDTHPDLLPNVKGYDVEAVRSQLETFPEGLYDLWQKNHRQFIQRLFYMQIPHRVLWPFVSGIAFVEAATRKDAADTRRDTADTPADEQPQLPAALQHLPKPLATERAQVYWQRLQDAGFVDADCQLSPQTSRRQAMYIAEAFAEKIGVHAKWSLFQQLWNLKNLAQEKWSFQQTAQMPPRSKEIDAIFDE